jgi:hypothetical protein
MAAIFRLWKEIGIAAATSALAMQQHNPFHNSGIAGKARHCPRRMTAPVIIHPFKTDRCRKKRQQQLNMPD